MVFGWHRSSSKRQKGTKLVRSSTVAQQTPSASASADDMRSSFRGAVGRHASLPARGNPPATPQFPPTYQPSPAASVSSFYSKGTVLSAPCSAGSSPRNAGLHTPQRRPGSVMVAGLESLPEGRTHEMYVPRSAASVHGGFAGPRRCSDGSTVSASSTLAPARRSCFFAPATSPQVDPHASTTHASAAYYYAQPQPLPPWNEPAAGNDASMYYTEPVDLPAAASGSGSGSGGMVETRRASVGTVIYEYSANVTHYPAGYYVVSPPPAVSQHRPVSYVYQGQGDYGSTLASPISPVTPEYHRYSVEQSPAQYAAPPFYLSGDAASVAAAAKGGYAYRALPAHQLKPGYYALRNSTHFAYIPLSLPPTPECRPSEYEHENSTAFSLEQRQPPLSSNFAPQSSAPLSVTIPAAEKYPGAYETGKADNSTQHAPDVDTVGAQYAYLPPRSTNLTITN